MHLRWLPYLLLSFALLIAQQGAALHALSHLSEPVSAHSQPDKQLPHSPACDKCVAYAQVGSGLHSAALAIPELHAVSDYAIALHEAYCSRFSSAYSSRAPPALV